MKESLHLDINGQIRSLEIDPRDTLLEVLRDRLGLTGTKRGCDRGECGACTVLLDGQPVNACMVLAVDVPGHPVITIEGLAQPHLHALQQAFVDCGAVQCGFCTPGMILTAKALLDRQPRPTPAQVRQAISGNLCRCTGYQKIVQAILAAARHLPEERENG